MSSPTIETWKQDEKGRWFMPKDPDDILDYPVGFTKWLAKVADTITSHSIILPAGTGLTLVSSSDDGQIVTPIFTGGTLNKLEAFTTRIVTVAGRQRDWTLYLKIKEA